MTNQHSDPTVVTAESLRRVIHTIVLITLLLPPFVGGSLMGLIGIFPMPEFYLVFTSYSAPYIAIWLILGLYFSKWAADFLTDTARLETEEGKRRLVAVLRPLPVYLLATISLYSIGGATSANLSLESMRLAEYTHLDYLLSYFGLIPVVLITAFPIYFYFTDYLGRFLGPRGLHIVATPLRTKLVMLGLVTPLLIDTVLITYFVTRSGEFDTELFGVWLLLLALAAVGTYLAVASFRQGLHPLQDYLSAPQNDASDAELSALSLDELGSLTAELAELLRERRQANETLKKQSKFVDAVVDNAGALIVVLDKEGRITRFNRACEEFSGYSSEDVHGRFVWDFLLPEEDAEKVYSEAFSESLKNPQDKASHYINRWIAKDGQHRTIEWTNTLLMDQQGQVEYMVSIGTDVTDRLETLKKLEQRETDLRTLNESLEARITERTSALENSNKELEAYSYSIAHDLRAPLRSIVGFSQIVLMDAKDKLNDEETSHLERIVNSGQHMAQLIDDILSLGRVSRQELRSELLDLSAIAHDALEELRRAEPNREVTFQVEEGLMGQGDPQLVRILLSNLLGNAWKYTQRESQPVIEFKRIPGQKEPTFVVQDNGIGFDSAYADQLFRPFHRLHGAKEFEGTGIGLATAQRIVHRHDGRIWTEAEVGKGASLFFTLPKTGIPRSGN